MFFRILQLIVVQLKVVYYFCRNYEGMTFDDITADGRLWAVRYDGETDNALFQLFDRWNDVSWLREFFKTNISDLSSYFRITDVNKAIYDTIDDAEILQCLIMDISSDADLDRIFRPLENFRTSDELLGKEKASEHTLHELHKLEAVRRYLLDAGIVDNEGFIEYLSES